jgi:fatty-acyl-CoA synthase
MHRHPAVAIAAAVGRPDARVGEVPMVYVQLKPGAEATTEELLSFAQTNIPERAAIPKQIYIIEQMPVTAVGKLFKPALVRMQINEVLGAALNALDEVAEASVEAVPSKLHGVEVKIHITLAEDVDRSAGEEAVQGVLGQYAFHYILEIM